MSSILRARSFGIAALVCGLFGACAGAGSVVDRGQSGSAGTGGSSGFDLAFGGGTGGSAAGVAGVAGEPAAPSESDCESIVGLDQCGATSVEATRSTASVLLVIDKSSSMDDQPEGFELKKWDALKAALEPALAAVEDEISFGLLLYPFDEKAEIPLDCFEGCCEVPAGSAAIQVGVEAGTRSAAKVMNALDATMPGGTSGDGKDSKGDRFVLLATDGGPNCGASETVCAVDRCTPNLDGLCPAEQGNCCVGEGTYCLDDLAVVQKIRALADAGVPTFVIGIPGTESYADYLDAFALAGGVPHRGSPRDYYAVSAEGGVDGLTRTFSDITTHLVRSCEIGLGASAPDKKLINVAVDCDVVPFADGAGWDIPSDAPTTLVLTGEACGQVQREGARRIDVVYGCPTVK